MNIMISNASKEPIYEQIKNQIIQSILRNELKEGDPLPSMRRLAQELRISVITTKRAYEELESEGFITSIVGKGSFVASQNSSILREKRLTAIEQSLAEIVQQSKRYHISLEELKQMLDLLYQEGS
ncbi:GntR family transcriptional regulator [Brevibacillus humidisoli]|uniref:GntR family transcriptional regulator n=1 Tax=Brevibacillus humidisoli TaxID=2895522 RepID=UPI001E54BB88|nr:GntR family transcriptional regulator [Brevibacillus humidisoli]UFJ41535.1 GntR family transcriptional regulator [Brevibacillus humidisoli]